jgi:hypothetical protein
VAGDGIHIMWIPSYVVVMGNERADRLAGQAVQGDMEFAVPVRPSDLRPLSRVRKLDSWQCSCSEGEMGRYTYSIWLRSHLYLGLGVLIATDVLSPR